MSHAHSTGTLRAPCFDQAAFVANHDDHGREASRYELHAALCP